MYVGSCNVLQYVRTEGWFVESASSGNVIEELVVLNARIWTATQTEHLPTCDSIRPLRERERGREGEREREREREKRERVRGRGRERRRVLFTQAFPMCTL